MKLSIIWVSAVLCLGLAAAASTPNSQKPDSTQSKPDAGVRGQKEYETHCSRCHKAPDAIRPSESKAVLMHMRVRAMIPEKDAKAILQFLAP